MKTTLHKRKTNRSEEQLRAALNLCVGLKEMSFGLPVVNVYNPLEYAWKMFEEYVRNYGATKKRVLFLGMNPGPWGMAQTGVPFGEIHAVEHWLKLSAVVERPKDEHPRYPVDGLACKRSECSGRRLWGLFEERFGEPEYFFEQHFIINYCPLLFIAESKLQNGGVGARNLTPDKLAAGERKALYELCDEHLRAVVRALEPEVIVGIGNFAVSRAENALADTGTRVRKVLHPSPASPKSNMGWDKEATRQLIEQGVWE